MKSFYSHGKLLLTAEYAVLMGARALALPCSQGQKMNVWEENTKKLVWESFDQQGQLWFEVHFQIPSLLIKQSTNSEVAYRLREILLTAQNRNPSFLQKGVRVETHLEFDRSWGLGSSSTLIANIGLWAQVNPYELLEHSFGGSGYDIACAQASGPICYTRNQYQPKIEHVSFDPPFSKQLFFVYLNQKQSSLQAIESLDIKSISPSHIEKLNALTEAVLNCKTQEHFDQLLVQHETLMANLLSQTPVKKLLFEDFNGAIKSLGAWGGDFVLASGDHLTPYYFNKKGFQTVIPFNQMMNQKV
ncbi:MAG: GYDIA family GHMP kinase [Flavobacteriaceae bacterium]